MLWTKHSEPGVLMQEGEGDDDDEEEDNNIADWAHLYEASAFKDEPMDKAEENSREYQAPDELGQVLVDAQRDSETLKESNKFKMMLITKNYCTQIASRGLKSWVPHWKSCNGRHPMMLPTRGLRSYYVL